MFHDCFAMRKSRDFISVNKIFLRVYIFLRDMSLLKNMESVKLSFLIPLRIRCDGRTQNRRHFISTKILYTACQNFSPRKYILLGTSRRRP